MLTVPCMKHDIVTGDLLCKSVEMDIGKQYHFHRFDFITPKFWLTINCAVQMTNIKENFPNMEQDTHTAVPMLNWSCLKLHWSHWTAPDCFSWNSPLLHRATATLRTARTDCGTVFENFASVLLGTHADLKWSVCYLSVVLCSKSWQIL